jgi:crotonobetainyl-CoA:carnitine CoA-transferase CaiB-like acyl-CoA transferase
MFAGLGHEVIKWEPPGGDYLRGRGDDDPDLMASGFRVLNAGKRSLVIDLDTDQGVRRARRLIESADVVISDLSPELLDQLGLRGADRRPGLVVVSLSSFGVSGDQPFVRPDSLLAESFGGLAAMIGEPDRPPLSLGGEQTAYSAGFAGFFGAMLALREPFGDFVDVALSDVAAYMDWKSDVSYDVTGVAPRRSGARFGRWRMVPAADGWVGIVYQPEQWDAMVALIDDPRLRDPSLETEGGRDQHSENWWPAVQEWASPLTRRDIFERAQRVGLAFGMSMDVADIVAAEQYLFRGFVPRNAGIETPLGPFFKSVELSWSTGPVPELDEFAAEIPDILPARMASVSEDQQVAAGQGPLHGMLVLDLGTITAGAATGRLLADYGATVIKIEAPDHPDSFRTWIVSGTDPANQPEVSPAFESNNAGKLGVAMNLKTAGGLEAFLKLVATADVVLENFRVGVTDRLGIDYQSLRRIKPDLVYLSLSSQGQDGPEALYRSYGSTLDMLSGLASVTGYGDGLPVWSSVDVNYPDQVVSVLGAGLVAYSWLSDIGTHIDLSQRETISWTLADRIEYFRATGIVEPASGNRRAGADPHDVYACAEPDSWVAIACFTDAQRLRLAALVGHADGDSTVTLDESAGRWARGLGRNEVLAMLRAAEIPSAPVLGADERAHHPHFVSRRVFLGGETRRKGFPLVLDGYRPHDPSPAPRLGQHTEVVLTHSGEAGSPIPPPESSVPEDARAAIT